jgi:hypothetical protein
VYLNGYAKMNELLLGLTNYFTFYNAKRTHQALANKTPDAVYTNKIGGGAMIFDKYPQAQSIPTPLRSVVTISKGVIIEKERIMQNAKTEAAPFSYVILSTT